jgi:hypothetical protein
VTFASPTDGSSGSMRLQCTAGARRAVTGSRCQSIGSPNERSSYRAHRTAVHRSCARAGHALAVSGRSSRRISRGLAGFDTRKNAGRAQKQLEGSRRVSSEAGEQTVNPPRSPGDPIDPLAAPWRLRSTISAGSSSRASGLVVTGIGCGPVVLMMPASRRELGTAALRRPRTALHSHYLRRHVRLVVSRPWCF